MRRLFQRLLVTFSVLQLCSCLACSSHEVAFQINTSKHAVRTMKHEWANSIGMKFVEIPAGSFLMGSPKDSDTKPVHAVTLSHFCIGVYEVTNEEYEHYKKRLRPPESLADRQPVTRVSYYDAMSFCQWLSHKEHRIYRLPSEAEWEYAARGSRVQTDYPWGNESPDGRAAITTPWVSPDILATTKPVGSYAPNGFGLHDVIGNVAEWTSDWYDQHYYSHSPTRDPKGPAEPVRLPTGLDREKVIRGGFFTTGEPYSNVYSRLIRPIDWLPNPRKMHDKEQRDGSGFRIVLEGTLPVN